MDVEACIKIEHVVDQSVTDHLPASQHIIFAMHGLYSGKGSATPDRAASIVLGWVIAGADRLKLTQCWGDERIDRETTLRLLSHWAGVTAFIRPSTARLINRLCIHMQSSNMPPPNAMKDLRKEVDRLDR